MNGSLAAAEVTDPVLFWRAASEIEKVRRVRDELARRVVIVPGATEPPVGQ